MAVVMERAECPPIIWEGIDGSPIKPELVSKMRDSVKICVTDLPRDKASDVLLASGEAITNCVLHGEDSRVGVYVDFRPKICLLKIEAESHIRFRDKISFALDCARKKLESGCAVPDCVLECGRGVTIMTALADRGVSLDGRALTMRFGI